jgi:hypothetical protein
MKRFTLAMALVCTLSVSALGGAIPCDYAPPPPPPDSPPAIMATSPGDTPSVLGDVPGDLTQLAESVAYAGLVAVVGWLV